jgi:hypothetical protein
VCTALQVAQRALDVTAEHLDVTGVKDAQVAQAVDGGAERLGEALVQPPGHDLAHLVRAHPARRHPVQNGRPGPVPAQPDLQEPVPAYRARAVIYR